MTLAVLSSVSGRVTLPCLGQFCQRGNDTPHLHPYPHGGAGGAGVAYERSPQDSGTWGQTTEL